ncbi:MAG: hydrogenase nickel incorporation protein HypB [Bacillota bacterium]|jgi:hydrogenase nickel incorporation protein HypB
MSIKVVIGKGLLEENEKKAEDLRGRFRQEGVKVVNLLSSPGAGKTSLLERVIPRLDGVRVGVIEGDIATTRDTQRLLHLNIPLVQITTMGACHLDSAMVWKALDEIDLSSLDMLFIENVGNLVCPSSFDLGEDIRAVVLSVTEGSDKPEKYPKAFLTSKAVVINKIDLLPYTNFDVDAVEKEIRGMVPFMEMFKVSCRTGEGIDELASHLARWVRG